MKTYEAHLRRQKTLKKNRERRDWERQQQGKDKGWGKAYTLIFGIGCVLFVAGWLAIGIAKAIILLSVGIIAGIVMSYVPLINSEVQHLQQKVVLSV